MPIGIVRYRVTDYDAWRPHFDRRENARLAHGIRNARIYRDTGDPNDLMLVFDLADESRLHFAEAEDLRAIMREAGVDMASVAIGILPD